MLTNTKQCTLPCVFVFSESADAGDKFLDMVVNGNTGFSGTVHTGCCCYHLSLHAHGFSGLTEIIVKLTCRHGFLWRDDQIHDAHMFKSGS